MGSTKRKRILAAALVLAALVAVELAARWDRARHPTRYTISYLIGDSIAYRPDSNLLWGLDNDGSDEDGEVRRINRVGFRGPELAIPKPAGTFRLLFLGSSHAFGHRTHVADSFPFRIAQLLTEKTGRRVETANGAVPGYSSTQMRMQLEDQAARLDPDLIVVTGVASDTMRLHWTDQDLLRRFAKDGFRYEPLWRRAARTSAVFQFLEAVIEHRKTLPRDKAIDWTLVGDPEPDTAPLRRVSIDEQATNLRAMIALARAQGRDICLLLLPIGNDEGGGDAIQVPDTYRRDFARVAVEEGACLLDMRPDFSPQSLGPGHEELFFDSFHPTVAGHERIAQAAVRELEPRVRQRPSPR